MAYLLRTLIILMVLLIGATTMIALGWISFSFSHIKLAIAAFLFTIFAQAFVMFYFIGVSRLVNNVYTILTSKTNLKEIFEVPPEDLTPYLKKTKQFVHDTTVGKRQTVPWTMLMLVLGMFAFLLGGAHDTGMVSKPIHSGLAYGFIAAMLIGFVRQWYYLGKTHKTLRKLKSLFSIPDSSM
jgi:ABC-type multidrug transport system fused ATPase/permease subunit